MNRKCLQNFTWGVLLIAVAVALIYIGVSGVPILFVVPLILIAMGVWIIVSGGSYHDRAWGIVLAAAGVLWLSQWVYPVSWYSLAGVFLLVVGVLVIIGSRKEYGICTEKRT